MPPATNGAIYQVGRDVDLFENPIARHVGDIVTIVLNEATDRAEERDHEHRRSPRTTRCRACRCSAQP